jgi:hypothetical protein
MTKKCETSHSDACREGPHYWILNDKSLGICKRCGAQKQFPIDVFGWQGCKFVVGKTSHSAAK